MDGMGSSNHSYLPKRNSARESRGVPNAHRLCPPSGWFFADYSVADFQLQYAGLASAHTPLPITCIRRLRLSTIAKPFDVTGLLVRNPSFHFPRDKFLEPQNAYCYSKHSRTVI